MSQQSRLSSVFTLAHFYLFAGIVGGAATGACWIIGFVRAGYFLDPLDIIQSTWTNSWYARCITIDFWTTFFAGIAFMVYEGKRLRMKNLPGYALLIFLAFAFAFAFFLYNREVRLKEIRNKRTVAY